jgi:hypothetical protein
MYKQRTRMWSTLFVLFTIDLQTYLRRNALMISWAPPIISAAGQT